MLQWQATAVANLQRVIKLNSPEKRASYKFAIIRGYRLRVLLYHK